MQTLLSSIELMGKTRCYLESGGMSTRCCWRAALSARTTRRELTTTTHFNINHGVDEMDAYDNLDPFDPSEIWKTSDLFSASEPVEENELFPSLIIDGITRCTLTRPSAFLTFHSTEDTPR